MIPTEVHPPDDAADTLEISVKAQEKFVNYDSVFRSIRASDKPEPAASILTESLNAPVRPQKQPETHTSRHLSGHPPPRIQQNGQEAAADRPDLAARGVMTAGLALILVGVVLELFLKRKGLIFLVIGMLALLAGAILL